MYNLKFVSVTYDETGKELTYNYLVWKIQIKIIQKNLPRAVLLDREKDLINMGTYDYGNGGVSYTFKNLLPYNVIVNIRKNNIFIISNDYKIFIKDKINNLI